MECVVVSACLMGEPCRYDGQAKPCEALIELADRYELVPICPEVAGGLPTPRVPAERVGERVLTRDGVDVTRAYHDGAAACASVAHSKGARRAILKSKSPACGVGTIYDGTFSGTLCEGNGILAELLLAEGLEVITEQDVLKA